MSAAHPALLILSALALVFAWFIYRLECFDNWYRDMRLKRRIIETAETEYKRGFADGNRAGFEEGFHTGSDNEVVRWTGVEDEARAEGYNAGYHDAFIENADEITDLRAELIKAEAALQCQSFQNRLQGS